MEFSIFNFISFDDRYLHLMLVNLFFYFPESITGCFLQLSSSSSACLASPLPINYVILLSFWAIVQRWEGVTMIAQLMTRRPFITLVMGDSIRASQKICSTLN